MKKIITAVITVLACTAAFKHYDQLEELGVKGFKSLRGRFVKGNN